MSDVKVEYEQTLSRDEVAAWLSQLARALTGDRDVEFPFGPGTVKLQVPGSVRAELEVEVEDNEVEVEIELTWPLPHPATAEAPGVRAASHPPEQANGAGRPVPAKRSKRK